ncbi:hypothetical protein JYT79_00090 [Cardiobacterium sp. AH-315-I02]|nr:hypothetical protein [Cardiobacterium sp. AH-315-I02]
MNTNTHNKPYISTNREARFLAQLLTGKTAVHDLRAILGAENHWQLKADLMEKGWQISTTREPFTDRDGQKIRAGYYELTANQYDHATAVIKGHREKQVTA